MVYREDTMDYEGKIVGSFLLQHCTASGLKNNGSTGWWLHLRGFEAEEQ